MLRFGHPEDKQAAAEFSRRQQRRDKLVTNVMAYYTRYVSPSEWPTVSAPHCFYPKTFNRVPLSVLQIAAERLQRIKLVTGVEH